jgi:hypothetical protein
MTVNEEMMIPRGAAEVGKSTGGSIKFIDP